MCLAWKVLGTFGRIVDRKSMPLKIIFISLFQTLSSGTSTNLCFSLRMSYLLDFSAKLIYFGSPSPLIKHQLESTIVILVDWVLLTLSVFHEWIND